MPEGHTIHRHARLHRKHLAGQEVAVSSPQGRFATGASILDGQRLDDVEAHGKHLFYHWGGGDLLHVHLGLVGRFRTHKANPPPPTSGTRLALQANGTTIYLSGPMTCELIEPHQKDAIHAKLGPDPLREGRRGKDAFVENLAGRRIPIGAALLDQAVVAGVGNVYRAEALFRDGIHPDVPARHLDDDTAGALWDTLVDQLRVGEKAGRIVTVDPADLGVARRTDIPRRERLYVYKRAGKPCRRCGTPIERWQVGGRKMWACPSCQPKP